MYTVGELLNHFNHYDTIINKPEASIIDLCYDTRKIYNAEESLFFALISQRDGHLYIKEAYDKGIRNFVLSKQDLDLSDYVNANFIWVESTMSALQEIATFHRQHFSFPVIGITGSNGKTIVKEWLCQLLSKDFKCYQSPKSYNSQLGVALSLWKMSSDVELAIIEAGISRPHEMDSLARMIQPTLGVFTNLGTAHREGFESKEEKFFEKWKLFKTAKTIISPSNILQKQAFEDRRILSWGNASTDYIHIDQVIIGLKETVVHLVFQANQYAFHIPFVDQASIDNVITCISVMFYLGIEYNAIAERIMELKPLEMRLQLKRGKNNSSIIDDSYSNDLASLQIALDFLNQQNQFKKRKLILSDFEGEEWNPKFENKIIDLLNRNSLNEIILVGAHWGQAINKIKNARIFESTKDLNESLSTIDFQYSTILIKGARKYALEKVTAALVEQSHETVLEINLNAIENNIQQYRSKLEPNVKVMAMVKAFSYGSGSFEVANVLQFNKIDYLTVAFVDEGVALRKGGITLPIMVLSPHESSFEDLVNYNLEPEIYSVRILKNFIAFLLQKGITAYPIHIKLDTGMHRLGFMPEEVDNLMAILKDSMEVRVASVFSHLVAAGDPNLLDFTNNQIAVFIRNANLLQSLLGYPILRHICNTSGVLHHPEAHLDMVRLGIGVYGFDMAPKGVNLEEVSSLKTTITQIKHLSKTETVGYDRKGILYRDSIIATVKIGYADGYNRRFGNAAGKMMINGSLVPTVGNICMDMCMLDITDIDAKEGDEVKVFPNLAEQAKEIGTIPYELLTGISSRVKRVYFYE